MRSLKILVIDDEQLIRWSFEKQLSSRGYKVFTAADGEEGIRLFELNDPEIVFVDNRLPNIQGLEVISRLKTVREDTNIVFMTAYGSIETAVKAMKLGAVDYITKPFTFQEIFTVIDNIKTKINLTNEVQLLRRQQKDKITFDSIIGHSDIMKGITQLSKKIARSGSTNVLLLGESGTGKDYFAKAIHHESDRSEKPFVTINCSSLPDTLLESELFGHEQGAFTDAKKQKKGLFEFADGGTVFLDEIGEMNLPTQVKLLSVLENRTIRRLGGTKDIPVDIRIIAATNKNLLQAIEDKLFREDLYYRLKVFQIVMPPLRDHPEDIPFLADHFINQFNRQFRKCIKSADPKAKKLLMEYKWPGNIRELRNVIERAVILETDKTLRAESLPQEIASSSAIKLNTNANFVRNYDLPGNNADGKISLYEVEKQTIINALKAENNNQTRAARLLGITRDTLRYKMKKYQL
jgi:two-component system, NtrC family, response regulator AtoC